MKLVRIILLFFIIFWLLIMAAFPSHYDSKRRMIAHSHHYDAPSEITKKALEEAKRLDRRDIIKFELVGVVVLGIAIYGFIRVGRKIQVKC